MAGRHTRQSPKSSNECSFINLNLLLNFDGFIFLNGINFPLEPSSDWKKEDYFNFFDKVFSEFRKAKLVVSLPRDPNNYVEREEKVEFRLDEGSALSSSSVEYTLIRGRLENKDLMRQLIIKESDVRNPKTDVLNSNLTFYGPNPYDPMVTTSINGQLKESKQITGGLWNFYSRKLLFDFNKYAKEYNKRIIERRNREKYPWLANS